MSVCKAFADMHQCVTNENPTTYGNMWLYLGRFRVFSLPKTNMAPHIGIFKRAGAFFGLLLGFHLSFLESRSQKTHASEHL